MSLTQTNTRSSRPNDEPSKPYSLDLVVPVYNEEARVTETMAALIEFVLGYAAGSSLVFADDGSTDATVSIIRSLARQHEADFVEVLNLTHRGKGAAVRAGLASGSSRFAAFCDVDLSTPLSDLAAVVRSAAEGDCLSIASRASNDATIVRREELRRHFAGKAFNRLARTVCPGISDTQCGAKAAPSWVWRSLLPSSLENGFAWDVEVIALARRQGIPISEVGVCWSHDERTTVHVVRDGVSMVLAVPRIGWRVRQARPDINVVPSLLAEERVSAT